MTREDFLKALPELVKNYQPAPDSLKHIANLSLVMLVGPSGSGKTTLIHELGLPHAPSDTTRPPRPNEKEGTDFYFRQDYDKIVEEFKNGYFVQVAIGSGGDFYSTRASSYPDAGTAVMAVMSNVVPIFRELGFARTISVFVTPPSFEEWKRRINRHHLSDDQKRRRLAEAERSISFALQDAQMHFIPSDESAAPQVKDLLDGKIDTAREQAAKSCAQDLLNKLKSGAEI